jgi:hypothetical protein
LANKHSTPIGYRQKELPRKKKPLSKRRVDKDIQKNASHDGLPKKDERRMKDKKKKKEEERKRKEEEL